MRVRGSTSHDGCFRRRAPVLLSLGPRCTPAPRAAPARVPYHTTRATPTAGQLATAKWHLETKHAHCSHGGSHPLDTPLDTQCLVTGHLPCVAQTLALANHAHLVVKGTSRGAALGRLHRIAMRLMHLHTTHSRGAGALVSPLPSLLPSRSVASIESSWCHRRPCTTSRRGHQAHTPPVSRAPRDAVASAVELREMQCRDAVELREIQWPVQCFRPCPPPHPRVGSARTFSPPRSSRDRRQ